MYIACKIVLALLLAQVAIRASWHFGSNEVYMVYDRQSSKSGIVWDYRLCRDLNRHVGKLHMVEYSSLGGTNICFITEPKFFTSKEQLVKRNMRARRRSTFTLPRVTISIVSKASLFTIG